MWLEPGSCWLSSRTYLWGLHLCQGLHIWQFFVCLWKITRLAIFRVHCKICNFLQAWRIFEFIAVFLLFSLFCIKFMRIVKNRKGDDFSLLCSLLCCSSSWKPDMDFTRSSWFYQFCEKSQGQWFSDLPHFHFLLQILQFLQLRANLDMSCFCRCQDKVGNCIVG